MTTSGFDWRIPAMAVAASGGVSAHGQSRIVFDELAQAFAKHRVVVHDEYAAFLRGRCAGGIFPGLSAFRACCFFMDWSGHFMFLARIPGTTG